MNTVVIGIGDAYRHDDGVGLIVAKRLRDLRPRAVDFVESDGEPTGLIDAWDGAPLAIVIDAVDAGAGGVPGRIYRLGLHHPALSGGGGGPAGSHGVPLGDAVALARALDRMPRRMLLFGVQVADVSQGVGLSPQVEWAAGLVVEEIAELLVTQRWATR